MKAIIIAAGMGIRLNPLTNDNPKCMLEIKGKTILQHQLEVFHANGITDISVIKGYKKEAINYPSLKYYINDNYRNNNILNSLFYAEKEMDDEFIASYSDILFGADVVRSAIESRGDIAIVVDVDWKGYYEGRTEHPINEAENVIFDADNNVVEIGKIVNKEEDIKGEFIGMLKCTKKGAEIFKEYFHKAINEFYGKPFIRAKTFDAAYLTDFIQYLVNNGIHKKSGSWRLCLLLSRP
ncbi:MAG: NTP transferase domain-containing protein, partial [Methanosarcinales archaeon]|nr:NTP transferase domain-containing protein [Methanosarcinales archaeon]